MIKGSFGRVMAYGVLAAAPVLSSFTTTAHAQSPGATFRDCDDCEMVVIPAGSFMIADKEFEDADREATDGAAVTGPSKEETINIIVSKIERYYNGNPEDRLCDYFNEVLNHIRIDSNGNFELKANRVGGKQHPSDNPNYPCNSGYWNKFNLKNMDYSRVDVYTSAPPDDQDTHVGLYCYDDQPCVVSLYCYHNPPCVEEQSSTVRQDASFALIHLYHPDHKEQGKRLGKAFIHLIKLFGGKKEPF